MLLTLLVAVTGAYVVTRLVANSLEERLSNQLLEAGRVVSDLMARQEIKHVQAARTIAYTRGMGEALQAGNADQIARLATPAAGSGGVESVMLFDPQGREKLHILKQSDGSFAEVSQPDQPSALAIVTDLLAEDDVNSLPKRQLGIDPVDGYYYYFTVIPIPAGEEVAGAVMVGTSLNTILPLLKNTSLADVVFYGENGQALHTTLGAHGTDNLFLQTISIEEETYQRVVQQDKTVEGNNFSVDERWYAVARGPLKISNDRLAVFAVILPLDFVLEAGSTSRVNYILIYSLAMVAVIVIGYLVARLIINPIATLLRASRAIAGGDLTQRTHLKSSDEIGVLANTFDHMTEKLQERTLELERTNRILEQMDRTKMRFIQISAHELRTPMTLVQGYAQMAQLKADGNADLERYTRGLLEGTSRMVEIIDSMLDVSRIDSNALDLSPSEALLEKIIDKVCKAFGSAFEDRKLNFQVHNLSDLPAVQADKDLLYKVFYHVIGNAIKYTPDGGSITVSGRRVVEDLEDPEIEIAVKDTGIGVDPQYQELIFEKFYQTGEVNLHSSGKTKYKGGGPGLGLAIARGIIDAHRGRIWLESGGHNEKTYPGSTVYVRLSVNGRFHETA
ncbi:MAG TPA: ATP-binding protein [Anaerolineales bacterium]|nr:ATP-binding protein [Anaerolineales bacterium]